jgi:hypothetical protein
MSLFLLLVRVTTYDFIPNYGLSEPMINLSRSYITIVKMRPNSLYPHLTLRLLGQGIVLSNWQKKVNIVWELIMLHNVRLGLDMKQRRVFTFTGAFKILAVNWKIGIFLIRCGSPKVGLKYVALGCFVHDNLSLSSNHRTTSINMMRSPAEYSSLLHNDKKGDTYLDRYLNILQLHVSPGRQGNPQYDAVHLYVKKSS